MSVIEMNVEYFYGFVMMYCIISLSFGFMLGYKFAKGRFLNDQRTNGAIPEKQSTS